MVQWTRQFGRYVRSTARLLSNQLVQLLEERQPSQDSTFDMGLVTPGDPVLQLYKEVVRKRARPGAQEPSRSSQRTARSLTA
jgi:hypothetical protein